MKLLIYKLLISLTLLLQGVWIYAQDTLQVTEQQPVEGQKTYQGLFWEISGNGLEASSYLYGTMHTQDERAFNFSEGVLPAFESCGSYAMELNMDSVDQGAIIGMLVMDGDADLTNLLSEEDYAMVDRFFQDSLGQGLFFFNKMQPLYTASMINLRGLQTQQEEALDLYFNSLAKEQEKQVYGLELLAEQIGAFNSLPYDKQAEGLVSAVEEAMAGSTNNQMDDMMDLYVEGDLDALYAMTIEEDSDLGAEFSKNFLVDRNHRMADRAEPLIQNGSVFIAVGAAHLPGEEGLIELLRAKGYTVQPK